MLEHAGRCSRYHAPPPLSARQASTALPTLPSCARTTSWMTSLSRLGNMLWSVLSNVSDPFLPKLEHSQLTQQPLCTPSPSPSGPVQPQHSPAALPHLAVCHLDSVFYLPRVPPDSVYVVSIQVEVCSQVAMSYYSAVVNSLHHPRISCRYCSAASGSS